MRIKCVAVGPGGSDRKTYGADEATATLLPPKNPEHIATAIERLLNDDSFRQRLSANAARNASERFDLDRG